MDYFHIRHKLSPAWEGVSSKTTVDLDQNLQGHSAVNCSKTVNEMQWINCHTQTVDHLVWINVIHPSISYMILLLVLVKLFQCPVPIKLPRIIYTLWCFCVCSLFFLLYLVMSIVRLGMTQLYWLWFINIKISLLPFLSPIKYFSYWNNRDCICTENRILRKKRKHNISSHYRNF